MMCKHKKIHERKQEKRKKVNKQRVYVCKKAGEGTEGEGWGEGWRWRRGVFFFCVPEFNQFQSLFLSFHHQFSNNNFYHLFPRVKTQLIFQSLNYPSLPPSLPPYLPPSLPLSKHVLPEFP